MTTKKPSELLSQKHIAYISKYTKATKDEIASLLKELDLDHPDGKMGRDAFRKWITILDIKPKEKPNASVDAIQNHVYRRFDRDGTGLIEFQEFISLIYLMTNGDEKPGNIFDLFDLNGDGELTKKELGAVWNKIFSSKQNFEKMFDKMDIDKNGSISLEEFVNFYPNLQEQGAWTTSF